MPRSSQSAGPPWREVTSGRAVNGPFGPHLARSMGPCGPWRQYLAGLTLGLLLRHLGGTARG